MICHLSPFAVQVKVLAVTFGIRMDEKIAKLQAATDEAKEQMIATKQALDLAEMQLANAKAKYKALPMEQQEVLQVTDTELPELIDAHLQAKSLYETADARYQTNLRYLEALKSKRGV